MITNATAHLIVTACNACQKVNPDNPQAVAESIEKMYEALKLVEANLKSDDGTQVLTGTQLIIAAALQAAEGKGAS